MFISSLLIFGVLIPLVKILSSNRPVTKTNLSNTNLTRSLFPLLDLPGSRLEGILTHYDNPIWLSG